MSFLSVAAPNVLVSTVKKAEDDETVIVRLYDIEGRDVEARLEVFAPLAGAARTNIIEDEGTPLKVVKNAVTLPVGHHAIETLKLRPPATATGTRPPR
jgi:alpha-mannosidase